MQGKTITDYNQSAIFGLTSNQSKILFSLEKSLILRDIRNDIKHREPKEQWLAEWEKNIICWLAADGGDVKQEQLYTFPEINEQIKLEHQKSTLGDTWYYLIMLEGTFFVAYTPLGNNKAKNKVYAPLKYKDQTEAIKEFALAHSIMGTDYVDRFQKTYDKTLSRLDNKLLKIGVAVVSTVAISAATAATMGALAPAIAVSLFGAQFAGLHGAALVSACLAAAGGGAIAVGGAGMAGGIIAIVGGGALLGAAAGGTIASSTAFLIAKNPKLALSQAAKLEVVLKEIVLNAQKDTKLASAILESQKEELCRLNDYVKRLELNNEHTKTEISNLKKSITYMEKAYKESVKFQSCFDIGLSTQPF